MHAIRDAAGKLESLVALHRQTGVRIDIFDAGDVDWLLGYGHTLASEGALLSFEGANEPNNFPITYNRETGGGTGSWLPVARFQRDLYAAVKADPALKAYPVFNVSEAGAEVDDVGLQWLTIPEDADGVMPAGTAYADFANTHNYVIGNCGRYVDNQAWQAADPTLNTCWDGLFAEHGRTWGKGFRGYTDRQLSSIPKVTTETGWDSVANPGGEAVQGKVLVNTYLAQFARGWSYTFVYQLGEGEGGGANHGLFHADWSPKLAATYIHNLTTILSDPEAPASPGGLPGSLTYSIAGQLATVHDLLLRKSNGVFALIIWGEQVEGANDVALTLRGKHDVSVYDVTTGSAPIRTLAGMSTVPLTVSDHALVVEVSP